MLIRFILLSLLFSCSLNNSNKDEIRDNSIPAISTKNIYSYSDDIFNISISCSAPYNKFVFPKQNDTFKASLATIVQVYNINNDLIVFQESWSFDILIDVNEHETTKSTENKLLFTKADINLDVGEYELIITIKDLDNNHIISSKKMLSLSSKGFGETILFSADKEISSQLSLDNNGLELRFQYFGDNINELTLEMINNEDIFTRSYKDLLMHDDGFYAINFTLPESYYGDIDLVISSSGNKTSRKLYLYDQNAMLWSNDIDAIVGVMGYILSPKESRALNDIDDRAKIDFVVNYWKDKDPENDTEENELLIELTNRFNFANENLRDLAGSGWSTDRGEIYIIYGEPQSRDIYTNQEDDTISEVWRYPSGFEFVFENKFGRFTLIGKSLI